MEDLTLKEIYNETNGCHSSPYLRVRAFDGAYPCPSMIAVTAGSCDESAETAWILEPRLSGASLIRKAIKIYDSHAKPTE